MEIDLSKPLKQGFWIGDEDEEHRVFVVVLYERLPTFCYHCGLVGHRSNSCNRRSSGSSKNLFPPRCNDSYDRQRQEVRDSSRLMGEGMDVGMDPGPTDQLETRERVDEMPEMEYGPWMLVSRRRGRGGGRGGTGGSGALGSRAAHAVSHD